MKNIMDTIRRVIGIDFGTTNSSTACMDDTGRPRVTKSLEGDYTTPSVLCIMPDGTRVVGREAKNAAIAYGDSTIIEVKRQLGVMGPDGKPIPIHVDKSGKVIVPEEAAGTIIKKLVTDAETSNGGPVGPAVVTVPAYFTDIERNATIAAARIAGLEDVEIMNEPTAAALYYGVTHSVKGLARYVIYDLGGGTFDVSVIEVENGDVRVITTDGVRRLGGTDFDMRMIERVTAEAKKQHGIKIEDIADPSFGHDLKYRVETARHSLSVLPEVTVVIPVEGRQVKFVYTRKEFESDIKDLVEQTGKKLLDVIGAKGFSPSQITGVVMVGGPTRTPCVKRHVAEIMGREPLVDADPDLVVCQGACIGAAHMAKTDGKKVYSISGKELLSLPGGNFTNVASFDLGCAAVDPTTDKEVFVPIIAKNESIPAKKSQRFKMREDGQTAVLAKILQRTGSESIENCVKLGEVLLSGLPVGNKNDPRIEVGFEYQRNGTMKITVFDDVSKGSKEAEIEHKQGMTQQEIREAAKKLEVR